MSKEWLSDKPMKSKRASRAVCGNEISARHEL